MERGAGRGGVGKQADEGEVAREKTWIPGQRFLIRLLSGVIKLLTTT